MAMSPEKLREFVNQSGFPLQIGLANLVERTTERHGWKVLYTEHSWRNPSAETEGFIDIVLENRHGTLVLVIECKRVLETSWIFLQPGDRLVARRHIKAWVTRYATGKFKWFDWRDLSGDPGSPESQYCVVPGQDPRSKPMLERIAADVVEATEGVAWEEKGLQTHQHDALRVYFSVIVTTAQLKVGVFDPDRISLADGTLPDAAFEEVSYVRFRKQLSTRTPELVDTGWDAKRALIRAKERTVFVINAEALLGFLSEIEIDNDPLRAIV